MRSRGASLFFLGFAFGALFIATLVSIAPGRVGAGAAQLENLEHDGLAPPITGLRRGDLHDTFNERRDGRPHEAIDIMAPRGTPVRAVDSGAIRKLFTSRA